MARHKIDADLKIMTRGQLIRELALVREAVREHRDAALTGRRLDDDKLYDHTLPEGSDACHIRPKPRVMTQRSLASHRPPMVGRKVDAYGKPVTVSHLRLMPPPRLRHKRQKEE